MVSATIGRAPSDPSRSERARRNIIARTTSRSTSGPMPAACERIEGALELLAPLGRDPRPGRRAEAVDTP